MNNLVLSIFPGIDLLGKAFEEEGFCVVRGPDILWGGDIKEFHPPAGVFEGIIGGPPCQDFCGFGAINAVIGHAKKGNFIPEFARCVLEAKPDWALMENVRRAPGLVLPGYNIERFELENRWFGEAQKRRRVFHFASISVALIYGEIETAALLSPIIEPACMAKECRSGRTSKSEGKSKYNRRRDFTRFCELQGLPPDFLKDAPFTLTGKYEVVGNAVPMPMGRAIAKAVRQCFTSCAQM